MKAEIFEALWRDALKADWLAEEVEFELSGGFLNPLSAKTIFLRRSQVPTKSRKEREMRGLDGSNPPRSSSQSADCTSLPKVAGNSRINAGFVRRKGTGEPWKSDLQADSR
jgi:hypothetical protein